MDEATIIDMYRDIVNGKREEIDQLKKEKEELARKLELAEGKLKAYHNQEEDLSNCPVCCLPYNSRYRLPMVGACGHTICSYCAESLENDHCPICRSGKSFRNPSKNFLAYGLLEHNNLMPSMNIDTQNTILTTTENGVLILNNDRTEWIKTELKLPETVNFFDAVHFNEEIYLMEDDTKAFYKLDKDLKWIRLADMNIGRGGITGSSLAYNGYIWLFGGMDEKGSYLKSVERYDPKEDKWTLMPDMREARSYANVTLWNDRIIVSGGLIFNKPIVECYNPEDGSGMKLPDVPAPYWGHFLVHYKEKLVAIGDTAGKNICSNVWQLDPQEENPEWKPLPPTRYKRACASGTILDDEIYAIGGQNWISGDLYGPDRVEIFDGEHWREGPPFPDDIDDELMSTIIVPNQLADRLCNYKSC